MNPFGGNDEGEPSPGESADAGSTDGEHEIAPPIPNAPSPSPVDDNDDLDSVADVDPETLRAFVACVVYANVALLLVFLGPMVWVFEGRTRIGAALFAVGALAAIRTYLVYREWDRSRSDREGDSSTEAGGVGEVDGDGERNVGDAERGDGDAERNVDDVEQGDGDAGWDDGDGNDASRERGSTPEA